jgi:hypothetical protein
MFNFTKYLFSRNVLFRYEDMYVRINVSHRHFTNDGTYSFYGLINHADGLICQNPKLKLIALNHSFRENQNSINHCVSRVLHQGGLFAAASNKGLFLGNGRHVSTNGLWISYHTNRYNYSTDEEFKELITEEAFIIKKALGAYYVMIFYIVNKNPSGEDFDSYLKDQEPIPFKMSELVNQYVNKTITKDVNELLFSAHENIHFANEFLKKAEIGRAMKDKELINKLQ